MIMIPFAFRVLYGSLETYLSSEWERHVRMI